MPRIVIKATVREVHRCIQALPLSDISHYSVKVYWKDGLRVSELAVTCDDPEEVLETIMRAEAFDPETADWEIE